MKRVCAAAAVLPMPRVTGVTGKFCASTGQRAGGSLSLSGGYSAFFVDVIFSGLLFPDPVSAAPGL
ncbi:hypothetical protein MB84_27920 (plasmid) [Pandoraea oxalativorans]|uniref:Uncharacterized protein n=1 Tax=Pandoraea oxalativorans TaxID=573737 RepID=A0A0G3IHL4_9BURK|nr:hypothetical protein MB84_27920 [Pandoraea oxalativorans]